MKLFLLLISINLAFSQSLITSAVHSLKNPLEGIISGIYGDPQYKLPYSCLSAKTIQQFQNIATDIFAIFTSKDSSTLPSIFQQFKNFVFNAFDQCRFSTLASIIQSSCIDQKKCTIDELHQSFRQNGSGVAQEVIAISKLRAQIHETQQLSDVYSLQRQIQYHYGSIVALLISEETIQKFISEEQAVRNIRETKIEVRKFLRGLAKGLNGEKSQCQCCQQLRFQQDEVVDYFSQIFKKQKNLKGAMQFVLKIEQNFKDIAQICKLQKVRTQLKNFSIEVQNQEKPHRQFISLITPLTLMSQSQEYEKAGILLGKKLEQIDPIRE